MRIAAILCAIAATMVAATSATAQYPVARITVARPLLHAIATPAINTADGLSDLATTIPEPATWLLVASALTSVITMASCRRRHLSRATAV